jgi:Hypervirulence associated proteins TUDOR domain
MAKTFEVGDHVSWNSEAGRVSGRIVRVHTKKHKLQGLHTSRERR